MDLATLIKVDRRKLGLSQRKLAARLGVSGGAVAQWEGRATKPALLHAKQMFSLFGLPTDLLTLPDAPYSG